MILYFLPDNTDMPLRSEWTAPSAIGTAGIGFGGQAGAEVTDFLVVLNTRAVRSYSTFQVAGP